MFFMAKLELMTTVPVAGLGERKVLAERMVGTGVWGSMLPEE